MKALFSLILTGLLLVSTTSKSENLSPAGTYTFANPCMAFAHINPIPNMYGCFSFSATNAGASDPNGFYSWNFGDGHTAIGTLVNHCYNPVTVPTIYTITVTYNSVPNCGPVPAPSSYTLQLLPPAQGTCIKNAPSYSLAALSLTVWSGVVIGTQMVQFDFGDGNTPGPFHQNTYTVCGNYIVTIKEWPINDPNNVCYAYLAVNIACKQTPTVTTTGMEKRLGYEAHTSVYPNPSPGMVTISATKSINGIILADLTGRQWLVKEKVDNTRTDIDITALPPGVYFMNCTFHDGSATRSKLVKE